MTIASDAEREKLIEGGRRLRAVLVALGKKVAPGVSSEELDDLAEHLIREGGDTPSLMGSSPDGAVRPFPATLCVSINDEVVHGIPNEHPKTLKEGDIVGLDLVLTHEGVYVDAAITVPVGKVDVMCTKSHSCLTTAERGLGLSSLSAWCLPSSPLLPSARVPSPSRRTATPTLPAMALAPPTSSTLSSLRSVVHSW